jgi:hypothetical protein
VLEDAIEIGERRASETVEAGPLIPERGGEIVVVVVLDDRDVVVSEIIENLV